MYSTSKPLLLSVARKVTEDEKHLIQLTFREVDQEHKGYLTREDVKVATVMLFGYKPSKYEVDQMFDEEYKRNENAQGMTLETFLTVMYHKMAVKDEDDEIRQSFLAFDTTCRGFLTLSDLKKVFSQIAPNMGQHTIESAFREIDRDGDGRVSYKDYEFMMKYSLQDEL